MKSELIKLNQMKILEDILEIHEKVSKYQPSSAGGTRSPAAMPHRLQRRRFQLTLPK